MNIVTKNFKANSEGKLNPNFVQEYRPLEDHEEVVLTLEHIGGAEIGRYIRSKENEYDFELMFKSKVKRIEGISLKDEDGKEIEVTPEVMLLVGGPIFDKIIYTTCTFLVGSYSCTKEEEKNSVGDSKL